MLPSGCGWGWWLVVGGWCGGWWLVVGGWWLVVAEETVVVVRLVVVVKLVALETAAAVWRAFQPPSPFLFPLFFTCFEGQNAGSRQNPRVSSAMTCPPSSGCKVALAALNWAWMIPSRRLFFWVHPP